MVGLHDSMLISPTLAIYRLESWGISSCLDQEAVSLIRPMVQLQSEVESLQVPWRVTDANLHLKAK